ncbi:MAG TPA: hypothetical protein G4N92_04420 [Anaerolineae bacterium]|nr:hypothetical protein [Anaerolineae bacterium]
MVYILGRPCPRRLLNRDKPYLLKLTDISDHASQAAPHACYTLKSVPAGFPAVAHTGLPAVALAVLPAVALAVLPAVALGWVSSSCLRLLARAR